MFEIGTTLTATSYFATLLIARSILLWAFGLLERHICWINLGTHADVALRTKGQRVWLSHPQQVGKK